VTASLTSRGAAPGGSAPPPPTPPPPPDQAERDRITSRLTETVFVEAGAGSGKTRALVDRIVRLIATGTAKLSETAAITFTEKAAAELRDRIRRRLDDELDAALSRADDTTAGHCRTALGELDGAAIGTLHSFARRLLTEHPIEAGLPPRVEVLDEVASAVAFDDRWSIFLDQLLADTSVERELLLATSAGVKVAHLRLIALAFNDSWDLAEAFAPSTPGEIAPWEGELEAVLVDIDAAYEQRHHCCDDDDRLLPHLEALAGWARRVREAGDEFSRLALLGRSGRPKGGAHGRKSNWPGFDLDGLKSRVREFDARISEVQQKVATQAVRRLAVDLRRFTLAEAERRRDAGQLEFHDLLVLARKMLHDPDHGATVRADLHRRYRHLLIDEFQDTDPIQVDMAVRIAAVGPLADDAEWHDVDTRDGHLFFVGDPKQSIYRFRRADISLFLQAADRFGAGARSVSLTTNFRTGPAVIELVNALFGALITEQVTDGRPSQPAYTPLAAVRADPPHGPPVAVLGPDPHEDVPKADEVRRREAADVAAAITRIVAEGWLVDRDPHGAAPDWQPAHAGDITILLPTRMSLPALEDALDKAGIGYRAESASLVYASRLVRDLLLTVRAIDDPTDELVVVSALRSPLFGCGDDDLFRFRRDHPGASFDHSRPLPDSVADSDPVASGLTYLATMHTMRRWRAPSELVDQVVRDRRLLELGEAEGRARDLWRRVRFVVDQARAWTDATNGTLRQYLAWIRQQTAEGSRVSEAVLPETDDDAVRIMTVHASKGLEFPIAIVSGLSTRPMTSRAGAEVVWQPGQECMLRVLQSVKSDAYDAWKPIDEQMSHDERVRLLYVACTRAQDHLVLSLHRTSRTVTEAHKMTGAELLCGAMGDRLAELPVIAAADVAVIERAKAEGIAGAVGVAGADAALGDAPAEAARGRVARSGAVTPAEPLVPFGEWRRERDRALAASQRPRTVAATSLTEDGRPDALADPGLHKRPRDLDLPPWQKGRYGSAIGRAVHAVLQTIDLRAAGPDAALDDAVDGAVGDAVDAAVAAQAAAEGVVGQERHLRALVDAALASPTVREAAGSAFWREVYVGVPLGGGRTLEGYVDLLYRRPGGLVVVDYKTGPAGLDTDLDPLVDRYRAQGASYALAIGDATGEPVLDMVFVFLTPEGPVDRQLPDLAGAVADIRRLAAGDEGLTVAT
jgi:ATP-dependent helicase/nuclease subunit A